MRYVSVRWFVAASMRHESLLVRIVFLPQPGGKREPPHLAAPGFRLSSPAGRETALLDFSNSSGSRDHAHASACSLSVQIGVCLARRNDGRNPGAETAGSCPSAPRQTAKTLCGGSSVLGLAVTDVERMATGAHYCETRDGRPMASNGFPAIPEMEIEPARCWQAGS